MNKVIDANIKNLLGPYYEWDDELYYHGHPLSHQWQTETERYAVVCATASPSPRELGAGV